MIVKMSDREEVERKSATESLHRISLAEAAAASHSALSNSKFESMDMDTDRPACASEKRMFITHRSLLSSQTYYSTGKEPVPMTLQIWHLVVLILLLS